MADQSSQIQDNALAPASTEVDGTKAAQHPLVAQIAADRYAAAVQGVRKGKHRGLRFTKLVPSGAMPDSQGTMQGFGDSGFDQGGF